MATERIFNLAQRPTLAADFQEHLAKCRQTNFAGPTHMHMPTAPVGWQRIPHLVYLVDSNNSKTVEIVWELMSDTQVITWTKGVQADFKYVEQNLPAIKRIKEQLGQSNLMLPTALNNIAQQLASGQRYFSILFVYENLGLVKKAII